MRYWLLLFEVHALTAFEVAALLPLLTHHPLARVQEDVVVAVAERAVPALRLAKARVHEGAAEVVALLSIRAGWCLPPHVNTASQAQT